MFKKIFIEEELKREYENIDNYILQEMQNTKYNNETYSEELRTCNNNLIDTLYVGNTKKYLDECSKKGAVLAVLNDEEDLFSFKYAIENIYDIDGTFLNYLYCRFNKISVTIAKTDEIEISEMNLETAKEYFEILIKYEDISYGALYAKKGKTFSNEEIEELAATYIEKAYDFYGYGIWCVYAANTNEKIGYAGVDCVEFEGENVTSLSYYIYEEYRQKGYATKACEQILLYMREKLDIKDIVCLIKEDNTASINVAKKFGLKVLFAKDFTV